MGNFVINRAASGELYFILKAENSQIIFTSKMYKSKQACFSDMDLVRNNCNDDSKYERKLSANNKNYFVLKASDGHIIGNSEEYSTIAGMENGIKSVKQNGTNTNVVEEEPYF
jgi:uncharacterized protein